MRQCGSLVTEICRSDRHGIDKTGPVDEALVKSLHVLHS